MVTWFAIAGALGTYVLGCALLRRGGRPRADIFEAIREAFSSSPGSGPRRDRSLDAVFARVEQYLPPLLLGPEASSWRRLRTVLATVAAVAWPLCLFALDPSRMNEVVSGLVTFVNVLFLADVVTFGSAPGASAARRWIFMGGSGRAMFYRAVALQAFVVLTPDGAYLLTDPPGRELTSFVAADHPTAIALAASSPSSPASRRRAI